MKTINICIFIKTRFTLIPSLKLEFILGDIDALTEKVLSVVSHVTNHHKFPGNTKHKQCSHGSLPGNRNKLWLKAGSFPVKKLEAALRGKNNSRLNDLEYMLGFTHTGSVSFIENV